MKMKAAVLEKINDISVKKVEMPQISDNEVLIKVHCIGVCGSDIHYYEHGRIGPYIVEKPIILGHELAGTVVEVGKHVHTVQSGDRVAVEPGVTCGTCQYCKNGRYNLCKEVQFMATPPYDGAWCEFVKIRADFIYKMPDDVSFELGAMLEPLSVGFHALQRTNAKAEYKVLITGLGPIGQFAQVACKLLGIHQVYGSDIVEFRRDFAMQQGFKDVCNPIQQSIEEKTKEWTDGEGFDLIIESSGNAAVIGQITKLVKRGGKIALIGLAPQQQIPLGTNEIVDGEIDVIGVFRYANTYPKLLQLLEHQPIDIMPYITHKYQLDDIQQAIDVAIQDKNSSMKIMIYPQP